MHRYRTPSLRSAPNHHLGVCMTVTDTQRDRPLNIVGPFGRGLKLMARWSELQERLRRYQIVGGERPRE